MSNLSCNNYILRLSAVLLAGLLVLLLPATSSAFFSGYATAIDNTFTFGTVSFDSPSSILASIDSSNPVTTSFSLTDTGSIDADYLISTTPVTCDADFYNGIEAELQTPVTIFNGMLNILSATSSSAGNVDLILQASSTMIATQNETCTVEITIFAWQSGFPSVNFGFSSTQTILLNITASEDIGTAPPLPPLPTADVVLNEIYPNPNSASSSPLNLEWVELYNGTGAPVDVEGWDLSEMSEVNENMILISSANTCAPSLKQGYARPYNGASTVIPAGGLLIIELCENSAMNNSGGETVRLYNSSDVQVDSYTFGATAKGKSHSRIPDGGTWVDPIPSPGVSNMDTLTLADLEAEGWNREQIIAVLGEDVYQDELITPPIVVEDNFEGIFGFATTSEETLFGFATSSATTSGDVNSSSTATASSTSTSTVPDLPVEVSTSSTSTKTIIETTSTSTQSTPDLEVVDEEKGKKEDGSDLSDVEFKESKEDLDKKSEELVVAEENNVVDNEDPELVPKVEAEKSDEDTPPEPSSEAPAQVTNEEI